MMERYHAFHSDEIKRKLLVIEDELINREILKMILQDDYELLFAECGSEALELIEAHYETLSLVLLDLNLPDMHGTDILQKMKGDPRTALLPVIVMTADQESEVKCLMLGAIDFISKPYPQQKVILARIRRTIELSEDRDIITFTERDHLTKLFNREYFYHYSTQFDQTHRDLPMDAIVVNVNHFHMLNERYGRAFGDDILRQIAGRLKAVIHEGNGIISRAEADTFLIYCPHLTDYRDLLESVTVEIGEGDHVQMRMGVYAEVDKDIDIARRFDRAKLAADTVRVSLARNIAIYDSSMHEEEVLAEQLISGFRTAIRDHQFEVFFQPKFDVRPNEPILSSAEALIRWRHPELGMISPGIFVPLFERNGLIREMDSFVWRETAYCIRKWKQTLGKTIPVSVNVSRVDLYDPKLIDELEGLIKEYDLQHEDMMLEITESAYTENIGHIIQVVKQLRDRGFHIEMDDFGTGYSSLNMISALPIDVLKMDMQFIKDAFRERKDTRLLEAIIGLAQSFDLPTVAEGVETAEQMFTLKSMGCDIVQGYYFSRPLPADEFEQYVRYLDSENSPGLSRVEQGGRESLKDRYTYDALHDPLTGLYNHSAFDILFHDSDKDHLAVMIAHVDGYPDIRAEYGREYADRIIKRVAGVLRSSFRSVDNICRLQEGEFVIIMSRMSSSMRQQVIDKVKQINGILQDAPDGLQPVSLSVGVAFSDREAPDGDVFKDADSALHRMEKQGKRGCAVY